MHRGGDQKKSSPTREKGKYGQAQVLRGRTQNEKKKALRGRKLYYKEIPNSGPPSETRGRKTGPYQAKGQRQENEIGVRKEKIEYEKHSSTRE